MVVSENGPMVNKSNLLREQSFPLGKKVNFSQYDMSREEREGVRVKSIGKEIRSGQSNTTNVSRGRGEGQVPEEEKGEEVESHSDSDTWGLDKWVNPL